MTTSLAKLELWNFGPVQHTALEFQRLHALIGPNDSGKSTILRAIGGAEALMVGPELREPAPRYARPDTMLRYSLSGNDWFQYAMKNGSVSWETSRGDHTVGASAMALFSKVSLLRLDPDEMRQFVDLIPDGSPLAFRNERGLGLGALLDAVFARNVEHYLELQSRLVAAFPTVAGFRLSTRNSRREVGIRLKDGTEVAAAQMSEGMLYFLAFSLLRYIAPPSILLVEEPENGLHPSRIAEVMKVLRDFSTHTQVIIATHSPLVVNELRGNEITVVTRDDTGTHCRQLDRTPNFSERSKVYLPGELWVSYADGVQEAPLFKETNA